MPPLRWRLQLGLIRASEEGDQGHDSDEMSLWAVGHARAQLCNTIVVVNSEQHIRGTYICISRIRSVHHGCHDKHRMIFLLHHLKRI